MPVAALAVGHRPTGVTIPFGIAAVAYALCVRECGAALIPRGVHFGLLGGQLLETAAANGAGLRQLQAAAATYLDEGYKSNLVIIAHARRRVARAIFLLTIETLALASALLVTLVG